MKTKTLIASGFVVTIDAEVAERIACVKWYSKRGQNGMRYAFRHVVGINGKTTTRYLHREILGVSDRLIQVDHINRDTLDNRKCNLRLCSASQNQANRGAQSNNKSGYKGVYWNKKSNRFEAQIGVNGKTIHLGFFTDAELASEAYKAAAENHFGEFSNA